MGPRLAAAAIGAMLIATGCGTATERGAGSSTGATETGTIEPEEQLTTPQIEAIGDLYQTPDTVVELDGTTLHVEIGPGAPPEAQALLDAGLVLFGCAGADDPEPPGNEPPPASAEGRFAPGERSVDVELAAAPAGQLILCAAVLPSDQTKNVVREYVTFDQLAELADGDSHVQEVDFALDGRRLTVTLGADDASESEPLLDRDLRFFCENENELGPYEAAATAEGRFPPGQRTVTVTLSADPGPDVFICGVEAKDGSAEALSFDVG